MKTLHRRYNEDHVPILYSLQLGADLPCKFAPKASWQLDAAGRIAFDLLSYVDYCRSSFLGPAVKLKPFDSASARAWWSLAESVFLESYHRHELHKFPELLALVTAPSKLLSPGRIQQAILDKLHARFRSFARPSPAYQT